MNKIAIPKNKYCPDQKRCIPLVKVYLSDYLVMGIVTMNLLKKTLLSVLLKNYYQFISKIIKLITNVCLQNGGKYLDRDIFHSGIDSEYRIGRWIS